MIAIDDRLRGGLFFFCGHRDGDAMFIRAADKKDVPLPRTMVSDVNIRREVRACQMTEVKQPVRVGEGGSNEDTLKP